MKVLLSIKPEFAYKIFNGTKKFEFRRVIFRNPEVKRIVVYASFPIQKIIGEFEIDFIINHDIETLWSKTKKYSGISKDYFFDYFSNKENGFAIKVKHTKLYEVPKCIKKDFNLFPPQSFVYIEDTENLKK